MKLTCYPRYLHSIHLFKAQTWIIFHFPSSLKVFFVSFLIYVTTTNHHFAMQTISSFHFSQHKHQVSIPTTMSFFHLIFRYLNCFLRSSFSSLQFSIWFFFYFDVQTWKHRTVNGALRIQDSRNRRWKTKSQCFCLYILQCRRVLRIGLNT